MHVRLSTGERHFSTGQLLHQAVPAPGPGSVRTCFSDFPELNAVNHGSEVSGLCRTVTAHLCGWGGSWSHTLTCFYSKRLNCGFISTICLMADKKWCHIYSVHCHVYQSFYCTVNTAIFLSPSSASCQEHVKTSTDHNTSSDISKQMECLDIVFFAYVRL